MKMGREEDMEELSLELSIGGKYGKADNLTGFRGGSEEAMDPQRRREIQAMRRHEARRKREEKMRKSRGVGFVEDKLFLEMQRSEARAGDREIRERDWRNRGNCRDSELGLSLFSEKKRRENECLYRKVQFASPCDSEYSTGVKSLEQCSSTVSDYHSISHKGESSSDTGSHSSHLRRRHVDSPSPAETDRCVGPAKLAPNADSSLSPDATNGSSTSDTPSKETGGGRNDNPPKPSNLAGCLPRMPCVSATGNGPNGRTVTGFLYRYNKTEVSIMCVCHGSSFSPAEFVEHAGGVDVAHPLRHITVVPPVMR